MNCVDKIKNVNIKPFLCNDENYVCFQNFLGPKLTALYNHEITVPEDKRLDKEEKCGYFGKYGYANCFYFDIEGVNVYLAADNSFKAMICDQYFEAFNRFSSYFGTGNAWDVVRALYENNGFKDIGCGLDRYANVALKFENCCYVCFKKEAKFEDEILRIDLFRGIDGKPEKPEINEFRGGLFHALKHFSNHGRNLSIGNEVKYNNIDSLKEVVLMCIYAFINKQKEKKGDDYICDQSMENGKTLRYVFYKEVNTNTCYIRTVHLV